MTDDFASDVLIEEVDEHGICVLTINRPQAMNSMNGELVGQLWHWFYQADGRDDIRVVILTGGWRSSLLCGCGPQGTQDDVGGRGGTEASRLPWHVPGDGELLETSDLRHQRLCPRRGGLEIALSCDIRIMAI